MNIFHLIKFLKNDYKFKKEFFENNTSKKEDQIALNIIHILNSFYEHLIDTELNKKLKNNPKWRFEKAIILSYFYKKISTEVYSNSWNDELSYIDNKIDKWTEYIYEKKLNLKDDENILWEINRYDEYDSKLSTDNNEFVNKTLNENFLELATYVQHFGYGDNEIDESKIFTKKIDFDAWMNCYNNTKIDFENLLIPGFEKIKKILEEF